MGQPARTPDTNTKRDGPVGAARRVAPPHLHACASHPSPPYEQVTCELIHPMPIEEGLRFAFREGGTTVGAGVVSKVLD